LQAGGRRFEPGWLHSKDRLQTQAFRLAGSDQHHSASPAAGTRRVPQRSRAVRIAVSASRRGSSWPATIPSSCAAAGSQCIVGIPNPNQWTAFYGGTNTITFPYRRGDTETEQTGGWNSQAIHQFTYSSMYDNRWTYFSNDCVGQGDPSGNTSDQGSNPIVNCATFSVPFAFVPNASTPDLVGFIGSIVDQINGEVAAINQLIADSEAYATDSPTAIPDAGVDPADVPISAPSGVVGPSDPTQASTANFYAHSGCHAFYAHRITTLGGDLAIQYRGGMDCPGFPLHIRTTACLIRPRPGQSLDCGPEYGQFDPPDGPVTTYGASSSNFYGYPNTARYRRVGLRVDVSATLTLPGSNVHWGIAPDGCTIDPSSDRRRVECYFSSPEFKAKPVG
jgi:hypothetical protein